MRGACPEHSRRVQTIKLTESVPDASIVPVVPVFQRFGCRRLGYENLRVLRGSFENSRVARIRLRSTIPLPQTGEGKKKIGALCIEKSPRPFRWERVRVRAFSHSLSASVSSMNHFVVRKWAMRTLHMVIPLRGPR